MSQNDNKTSIFQKILDAGNAYLDSQIVKAKTQILNSNIEDDFFYSKAVIEDPSYSLHSQGWKDKPYRVQNSHLKQMSYQDTAVAAVIQTRQNQVAGHSKLVKSEVEKGWMVKLADEDALLEKIKEELKLEMQASQTVEQTLETTSQEGEEAPPIQKADGELTDSGDDETSLEGTVDENPEDNTKSDDEVESVNWELERKAREKLNKQFEAARKKVEDYIKNCGRTENRPFESLKWNFDAALRAMVRDSLTYDLYAVETVPDRAGRPHHWFPVDGGTIKMASKDLRKYRDAATNFYNIDILYPERSQEAEEKQKVIDLKPELLEKDAYKWVQVIKGKVERAYTSDELKVGIRNVNTDIYNNGYGISELELLVSMVTGHLNAEYYNQAYFTQGFSAKGILHIKAAINRRKLDTVKMQWQHMLKGARNSFQTPIFAGVEDVNWIPLTQNHNDIGFEGWMRYLVTMIGAIFQIDPAEMGIHFKAEGGGGSLGTKDDSAEKINSSKDRGLYPLIHHLETFINENIVKPFDARFILVFTGVDGEDAKTSLERQEKEVKFKKTVNEIRAEDGLPPLPGMDDVILDPQYMAWYNQHSDRAKKLRDENQKNQEKQLQMQSDMLQQSQGQQDDQAPPLGGEEVPPEQDLYGEGAFNASSEDFGKSFLAKALKNSKKKSYKPLTVEVYKIEK